MIASKIVIGAVFSGIVGLCFLSYLIIFGNEHHNDQIIKSKRLKKRLASKDGETAKKCPLIHESKLQSILIKCQADQKFFTQNLNMGEFYLNQGDTALSVKYLAKAMMSCQNPSMLYKVLRNKLPKHVFEMLTKELPSEKLEVWSSSS